MNVTKQKVWTRMIKNLIFLTVGKENINKKLLYIKRTPFVKNFIFLKGDILVTTTC